MLATRSASTDEFSSLLAEEFRLFTKAGRHAPADELCVAGVTGVGLRLNVVSVEWELLDQEIERRARVHAAAMANANANIPRLRVRSSSV